MQMHICGGGELAALRAADGRAASPGREEGAINPLKEEARYWDQKGRIGSAGQLDFIACFFWRCLDVAPSDSYLRKAVKQVSK